MLRTVLINDQDHPANSLRYLADYCGAFSIVRELLELPSAADLRRHLDLDPDILLLAMYDERANSIAAEVRRIAPQIVLIGIGPLAGQSNPALSAALPAKTTSEELLQILPKALASRMSLLGQSLFCFLPAKAGSGCSTIVLNTAASMARQGKRVLLIDADLRSSVVATMAGVNPPKGIEFLFSELEILSAHELRRYIVSWHGVDILASTRSASTSPPTGIQYLRLLRLLFTEYDVVLIDLPELINPATIDAVLVSSKVFIVCTPELPALSLAGQRRLELSKAHVSETKIELVVNRWHKDDPDHSALVQLLEHEPVHILPNDYSTVRVSIDVAGPVVDDSRLAGAVGKFAKRILALPRSEEAPTLASRVRSLIGMVGGRRA
ncbi:MAG: AAA family ATPase [Acidobacteria bacterium]|nr:AAA family ATPase [Acidobacteriota bacterium]